MTGEHIVAVPESIRKIEAEEAARLEARKAEMKAAFAEAGVSVDSVPLDQLAAQSGRQKTLQVQLVAAGTLVYSGAYVFFL